ncbi:hypothetical protein COR50_12855 [Chitinophaga caeni]|uniref:Uncharacterized protein n=1 Tax=Chitinophaga caeni TaxID=2029983 RepID=A0A291QVM9_9BACT|nr:hypothetical protein [Chitinophaga caeni]ATL47985.1 hypothetical protein COR50_12855 [Chitinophaga caeni]
MRQLSHTWFADGYIDFELKKYTLLAYLQAINEHFNQVKLYPSLSDLVFHFNNLVAIKEHKHWMQQQFPKKLSGVDLEKVQLLYERIVNDDEMMAELEDIIEYAIAEMEGTIQEGTGIYDFIEEHLGVEPVGIMPLKMDEGFMLLRDGRHRGTLVYQYRVTLFERHDEQYRGIHMDYRYHFKKSFSNTREQIKYELIKKHQWDFPNPAVFCIETDLVVPVRETLLPIAKRSLVKYISTHAA